MSRDVVVLVGNPRADSRTRAVAERLAAELADPAPAGLALADLTAVSYSAEPAVPTAPAHGALDLVRGAAVLIVATPSYKGTYTGLLKLFLDQLGHQELAGVVAIPL